MNTCSVCGAHLPVKRGETCSISRCPINPLDGWPRLESRYDKRLEQQERLEQLLAEFKAEPDEIHDLLPALFSVEMINDDEIAHYVKYLRKAVERWQQRQLGPYVEDEMDAYDSDPHG